MYTLYILEKKKQVTIERKIERRIMYHIYQQLLPHHSYSGPEEMTALHGGY